LGAARRGTRPDARAFIPSCRKRGAAREARLTRTSSGRLIRPARRRPGGTGLFAAGGDGPFAFTTLRGGQVTIWGQGLYRYDTAFYAAGNRGTDAVMLCLGVPLLIATAVGYSRGSLRAGLLLLGALGYSLYLYATLAFNAAYNSLFLAYVALLSASLFAFIGAFAAVDRDALPARWRPGLPRRGLAAFMFAGGAVTLLLWGEPLVTALLRRQPPALLDSYTTMVTYALDLAVVTPATLLCGALVWRRRPLGYVMAVPLLTIIVLLLPTIAVQTFFQVRVGIAFTPPQIAGPIAGFSLLGAIAAVLLVRLLRHTT
jgi:hypothetical protein